MESFTKQKIVLKLRLMHLVQMMIIVFCISPKLYSQPIPDSEFINKITYAFESGNANLLVDLMHNKVDMSLLGESGIYSNQQAKFILSEFFKENKPEQFTILSNDENQDNTYLMGKALINGQFYKVYLLIKVINNEVSIYQIRIEK